MIVGKAPYDPPAASPSFCRHRPHMLLDAEISGEETRVEKVSVRNWSFYGERKKEFILFPLKL
jgi:hypothetical protein